MKRFFYLSFIVFVWAACSKENKSTGETSNVPQMDNIDTSKALTKYTGTFVSAPGKSVSGKALILLEGGVYKLGLENVTITNGPDLYVYLAKDIAAVEFIDLGKLKSTSGNQLYPITGNPNFTAYKYALIYCRQFNVLFGSAELK